MVVLASSRTASHPVIAVGITSGMKALMIRTAFTTAFDLDYPIAQAPMGGSVTLDLIFAVCEAGGLGMQGVSWHDSDKMVAEIAEIRRRTARLFAVNLVLEWDQHTRLAQCIDAGAPVISLFWGDPTAYFFPDCAPPRSRPS